MLLSLTAAGERAARAVLAERSAVLDRALDGLDDTAVTALSRAVCAMLGALTDDLLTSEFMCRLCDEHGLPGRPLPGRAGGAVAAVPAGHRLRDPCPQRPRSAEEDSRHARPRRIGVSGPEPLMNLHPSG